MDLGIEGRTAFVAGASSGLGYAVAFALAREGCRVAICSRDEGRIAAAAARLVREAGVDRESILPLVCDVTVERAAHDAVDRTGGYFGGLHILVTNAGGPPPGYIDDLSLETWRAAIELNLISTIQLCRAALPHLRAAAAADDPLARILMITSISAKRPIPGLYLSNAARAGVQGFAKSLSEELGPAGITVNTILPGYTRTERLTELAAHLASTSGASVEDIEAGWAEGNALRRIAEPEEFASAAVFLVSKRAAYITGVGFPVDGGWSKHVL